MSIPPEISFPSTAIQRCSPMALVDAEAQTRLSSARIDLVDRQIDLFLALGGGWE